MSFALRITSPDGGVREVQLKDGETAAGRDPTNSLVLGGRGVSRKHAKFVCNEDRLTVIDLGSTYGTKVNDMPTLRRELAVGDRLNIGMYQMEVIQPHRPVPVTPLQNSEYFPDEPTRSPSEDVHARKTLRLDASAIQFVLDNPNDEGQAVQVLSKRDSDIIRAVERFNTGAHAALGPAATSTMTPRTADYQALLLMYKVSTLLGSATDLDSFISPVADLVMEEVNADTVVVLLSEEEGDLDPQVIRHRGVLDPGEVPVSRSILDLVLRNKSSVISADVFNDDRIKPGQSVALYNIRAVVAAPLMLRGEIRGVLYLHRAGAVPFNKPEGDLVSALAALIASGIERSELKEHVADEKLRRKELERFHPPEVVDQIFSGETTEVGGELQEHKATAMVCVLRGFQQLLGAISPQKMAHVLHEYYDLLYEKVFANGGSLVKLHDGWALALFGMHGSSDRDAAWAVEAGRALCDEFSALARLWPRSTTLSLRCALDTGQVVAGVVGSIERLEYTALGLPISTTSAIASTEGETELLLTEETWARLPQKRYQVEPVNLLPDRKTYRVM